MSRSRPLLPLWFRLAPVGCVLLAVGAVLWATAWTWLPALAALGLAGLQVQRGLDPRGPAGIGVGAILLLLWAYGAAGFLCLLLAVVAFASLARSGVQGPDR